MGLTQAAELQAPSRAERAAGWLRPSRWSDATRMGLLFLLALLPYLNALRNGFVDDDGTQILRKTVAEGVEVRQERKKKEQAHPCGVGPARGAQPTGRPLRATRRLKFRRLRQAHILMDHSQVRSTKRSLTNLTPPT